MMDSELDEIRAALQNNDQALAAEKTKEYLEKLEKVSLNIAVTGECGSGKSSLVNALRGLDNRHDDAAPTGSVETTVETTMEPTEYTHPDHPNVKLWDLPGVGTTKFTADKYLKHVRFEKYDFFIIVSSDRFRENDAKLAKEIQKMKKKFYFVRSKIDHKMADEARSQKNFDKDKTLKRIRDNCTKELKELGIESPQVFLVSIFEPHLYDSMALWETLEEELPEHKWNSLLLSLSNISLDIMNKKIKSLEASIKSYALASAAGALTLNSGMSLRVDRYIIRNFVTKCQVSLGLTEDALCKISIVTGVSLEDLKTEIKSPFTGVTVTTELVIREFKTLSESTLLKKGLMMVPLIGLPIVMGMCYSSTSKALKYLLRTLAEDAQRVYKKVSGS